MAFVWDLLNTHDLLNPAEVMGIYRLWLDRNVNTPPGWTL